MATESAKPLGLDIYQILREAQSNAQKERRDTVRYAFFRPVTLHIGNVRLPAFSREISESGIGLLHSADLCSGEIVVAIPTEQGYAVHVRTHIAWCTPCGHGWFISGGEFVGIDHVGG